MFKNLVVSIVLVVLVVLLAFPVIAQAAESESQSHFVVIQEGTPQRAETPIIIQENSATYEKLLIALLATLIVFIVMAGYVFKEQSSQLAKLVPVEFVQAGLGLVRVYVERTPNTTDDKLLGMVEEQLGVTRPVD